MRAARLVLVVGNVALALAALATFGSTLGWTRWHHDAAYAALALAALASWRLLRRRPVTSLLLASLGAWSTLTGLLLVYAEHELDRGRWLTWWHGATSAGFFLVFLAHWARNHPRLLGLAGQLSRRRGQLSLVAGAWALLAASFFVSSSALVERAVWDRHFDDIATLAFAWAAAALMVGALVATGRRMRARLAQPATRNRVRGAVDVSLWLAMWLTTLTGFPLLYLTRGLRALDAYWLTAAWHVILSALLLALVAVHVSFNARPLRSHARR